MRTTSTDPTTLIVRVPAQPGPAEGTGPSAWAPSPEDLPAEPEPLNNPRLTVLAWLFPLLTSAGLGVWGLTTAGLGEDELATWGMVTAGWADFREVLANVDASVAPYYLLLRVWAGLAGDTDLALRLPSVIFAALAAALVAGIGIRLGGRRVGLGAGLIFALLPMTSRYAQEARPYAMTMFAAVLATLVLLRLVDRPQFPTYLTYTMSLVLLGLAHVVALLLVPAHGVIVWRLRRSGHALAGWAAAALVGVLPVLPLLYLGFRQSGTQIGWIPPLSWARLAETPDLLFGGAFIAGAVLALALSALSMRDSVLVATVWALVPAAGLAAASAITPLWVPRYLLFVLPAWALLASLALRRLTLLRGLVAIIGISLLAVPAQLDIRTVGGHAIASADIARVLRANIVSGDTILFGPFDNGDQRTTRDAVMRYLEPSRRPADKLMQKPPRTGGRLGAQECPEVEVPSCFGRPDRVWVVRKGRFTNVLTDIGPAKEQLLKNSYIISETWPLKGFTVALYIRKPAV